MRFWITTFIVFLTIILGFWKFAWEFPFTIDTRLLDVVAGIPVYIESNYEENATFVITENRPKGILGEDIIRKLPWSCSLADGSSHQCVSILKDCDENSQFSYSFWSKENVTCEQDDVMIQCVKPVVSGQNCQHLVRKIQKSPRSTHFQLMNSQIGAKFVQEFVERKDTQGCYTSGDLLETQPNEESEGKAKSPCSLLPLRFNENRSTQCWFTTKQRRCEERGKEILGAMTNEIDTLCSCGKCDTNMVFAKQRVKDANSSTCLLPTGFHLLLTVVDGSITGAVTSLSWSDVEKKSRFIITKTLKFVNIENAEPQDRFSQQRGRFHCPSEVSCWKELWFPLYSWKELTSYRQIGLLVLAIGITLSMIMKK